jgi:hypothetical protein
LSILLSIQVIETSPKVYELEGQRFVKAQRNIKDSGSQGDMILCGLCQYLSYSSQNLKFSLAPS